ncbi:hypothetical protein GCK72_026157 [Caenorhabditis remanei]|uniref:SPK domain-containing protein n=1 Tax=Caenorhabditis remanei TaxID=31234 RepID=A0A6A5G5B3_CAERE|nr:hypothetical protein GCK72_026157 [Caenorhabditis remanei]KAF1749689.1 hypothetical protein GCK72_026157 [Caenorhabditis remanei]
MTKRPQQVLDQNQKEIIHLYKFIGRKCDKASTFLCLRTLCELYSQRPHKPLQSVDVLFNQSYRGLFNHANLSCLSVKCRLQVIYFLRIPIHPQFFDRVKYDFELLLDVTGRIRYGKEKNRQFVLGSQDFTRPLLEYVYQHDLLHFMAEFCQDQNQPVSDKELAENYVKNNKCVLPISELIKQINIVKPAIQKEQNYHYLTIIKILFMIQYPVNDYYEKKYITATTSFKTTSSLFSE